MLRDLHLEDELYQLPFGMHYEVTLAVVSFPRPGETIWSGSYNTDGKYFVALPRHEVIKITTESIGGLCWGPFFLISYFYKGVPLFGVVGL